MLTNISKSYLAAKKNYDRGTQALTGCIGVASECLEALRVHATLRHFGNFSTSNSLAYSVADAGGALSRPYRPELFIHDPKEFEKAAEAVVAALRDGKPIDPEGFDRIIYTAVTSFSLSYDLWKPKSRKTPGTFFEVLIGSATRIAFPDYKLTKHIPIKDLPIKDSDAAEADALVDVVAPDGDEEAEKLSGDSVSTDLVITNPKTEKGAVIPLKITTRERIVQPFAHQRILDSAYPGQYASFVACISEVQRDDNSGTVKQICVPGTVALFQKHLARINGLYYCDIPRRYAQPDFTRVIPVKPFHALFADVADHLRSS
jgi:hypothetical protein